MKSLKEYMINESFQNNLHDKMDDLEKTLTNKILTLVGKNNTLTVSVDNSEINFLTNTEQDNESMHDVYSAAGILLEKYLVHLLETKVNNEDYFEIDDQFVNNIHDLDNGTYENYDLTIGDMCFEMNYNHIKM